MLKNNRKIMFVFLLIPTYFALLIISIGLQVGSIEWVSVSIFIILNLASAWLLSYKKNLYLNVVGVLFFIGYGWSWFSIIFNPPINYTFPPQIFSWKIGVYLGIGFMLIGLFALSYGISNRMSNKKYAEDNKLF